jgi:hypothetical protein
MLVLPRPQQTNLLNTGRLSGKNIHGPERIAVCDDPRRRRERPAAGAPAARRVAAATSAAKGGRMIGIQRRNKGVMVAIAGLAIMATLLAACGNGEDSKSATNVQLKSESASNVQHKPEGASGVQKEIALYPAMRDLWSDHMQWTYATVDAFFHNQAGLQPTLDRLLKNQKDIGAAIVPYYGQAAGDKLTGLLTTHINQAVPVLKAAQANDKAALDKALADWYANAKEIADFVSGANPNNWPTSATEPMLKAHIDQTTTYATDLLKGDYTAAVTDFDKAKDHMMMLADTLAKGIIAQYPDKFAGSAAPGQLPRTE